MIRWIDSRDVELRDRKFKKTMLPNVHPLSLFSSTVIMSSLTVAKKNLSSLLRQGLGLFVISELKH